MNKWLISDVLSFSAKCISLYIELAEAVKELSHNEPPEITGLFLFKGNTVGTNIYLMSLQSYSVSLQPKLKVNLSCSSLILHRITF